MFWLREQPIPLTSINLALLVIAIQVLVSLYATYDIAVSLQKVTGVIWGMTVFFALVRFGTKRIGIFISTLIFILGSVGISVLGLLGIEWPTNKIIVFNSMYEQFPKFSSLIPGLSEGFGPNEVRRCAHLDHPLLDGRSILADHTFQEDQKTCIFNSHYPLHPDRFIIPGIQQCGLTLQSIAFSYIDWLWTRLCCYWFCYPKKSDGDISLLILGAGILSYFILNDQFIVFAKPAFSR